MGEWRTLFLFLVTWAGFWTAVHAVHSAHSKFELAWAEVGKDATWQPVADLALQNMQEPEMSISHHGDVGLTIRESVSVVKEGVEKLLQRKGDSHRVRLALFLVPKTPGRGKGEKRQRLVTTTMHGDIERLHHPRVKVMVQLSASGFPIGMRGFYEEAVGHQDEEENSRISLEVLPPRAGLKVLSVPIDPAMLDPNRKPEAPPPSFLARYWWIFIGVFVIMMLTTSEEAPSEGAQAGSGGGQSQGARQAGPAGTTARRR